MSIAASLVAASLALASPMTSGQFPLDAGEREFIIDAAARRRRRNLARRTVDASLLNTDAVPDAVQDAALRRAASKRARRASRGW